MKRVQEINGATEEIDDTGTFSDISTQSRLNDMAIYISILMLIRQTPFRRRVGTVTFQEYRRGILVSGLVSILEASDPLGLGDSVSGDRMACLIDSTQFKVCHRQSVMPASFCFKLSS